MRKEECLLLLGLVAFTSTGAMADNATAQDQSSRPSQGILTTAPLLSDAEQAAYRARVRAAQDADEVERIRTAHYELMKARARAKGVVLPENRPSAFGVEGNAFGPQLISEEVRAAQRARVRAGRETQTPAPVSVVPTRQEPADSSTQRSTTIPLPEVPVPPAMVQAPTVAVTAPVASSASTAPVPASIAPASAPSPAAAVQPAPVAVPPATAAIVLPGIESIFGTQLMTEEEKAAFRARLRSAKTDEARQQIRAEREQQLRMRAKERGVALPQ